MIEKYLGEQFSMSIIIPAFGYNDCEEIEITLYNKDARGRKITYLKSDGTVMNASGENQEVDILISAGNTYTLGTGVVVFEIRRKVAGEIMPIVKLSAELLLLLKSVSR